MNLGDDLQRDKIWIFFTHTIHKPLKKNSRDLSRFKKFDTKQAEMHELNFHIHEGASTGFWPHRDSLDTMYHIVF